MFRDVLVVVDATSDAREALNQAIDLAQREHSRLTLITVERVHTSAWPRHCPSSSPPPRRRRAR
jgi:nucleotide-binding universal stress UspA family protein